jgi:hypothetical protein
MEEDMGNESWEQIFEKGKKNPKNSSILSHCVV